MWLLSSLANPRLSMIKFELKKMFCNVHVKQCGVSIDLIYRMHFILLDAFKQFIVDNDMITHSSLVFGWNFPILQIYVIVILMWNVFLKVIPYCTFYNIDISNFIYFTCPPIFKILVPSNLIYFISLYWKPTWFVFFLINVILLLHKWFCTVL